MANERLDTSASRWISVVFLQGDSADELLNLIDRRGATAAIERLQAWDFGAETTEAALTNGYVFDQIPAGRSDETFQDDRRYALTYSAPCRYVSLLRRYPVAPDPELAPPRRAPAAQFNRLRRQEPWTSDRDRTTNGAGPVVAL